VICFASEGLQSYHHKVQAKFGAHPYDLNIVYGILQRENVNIYVVLFYLVMEWIISVGPKVVLVLLPKWIEHDTVFIIYCHFKE
jgi:hypothetical protein